MLIVWAGLHRVRDKLLSDLRELNKAKPRGNADDNLIAEITRLEPALTVARDDLVRSRRAKSIESSSADVVMSTERLQTPPHRNQGRDQAHRSGAASSQP